MHQPLENDTSLPTIQPPSIPQPLKNTPTVRACESHLRRIILFTKSPLLQNYCSAKIHQVGSCRAD